MNAFAAALSQHPVPTEAVGELAGALLEGLDGERADLLVLFLSPHFAGATEDVAGALRRLLEPVVMIGGAVAAVIGGTREIEDAPGISAWAARLPTSEVTPVALHGDAIPEAGDAHTLLLLADPFSCPVDALLESLHAAHAGLQVIGGLASAAHGPGGNRLVLDGRVHTSGAVGALLAGDAAVQAVVSQGCRPVGRPFVVTDAEGRLVRELGGRAALDRVRELAASLPEEDRGLLHDGLHVGLVMDEHLAEFGRGDFLVRNVLGGVQEQGAIAVGAEVEVGRTLQFHVRDADAADVDLRELLTGRRADAALLFTCTGRGRRLFGTDDHDAGLVDRLLGPLPLAGAFCAAELGPVGGRSHVHGFTASLALFER